MVAPDLLPHPLGQLAKSPGSYYLLGNPPELQPLPDRRFVKAYVAITPTNGFLLDSNHYFALGPECDTDEAQFVVRSLVVARQAAQEHFEHQPLDSVLRWFGETAIKLDLSKAKIQLPSVIGGSVAWQTKEGIKSDLFASEDFLVMLRRLARGMYYSRSKSDQASETSRKLAIALNYRFQLGAEDHSNVALVSTAKLLTSQLVPNEAETREGVGLRRRTEELSKPATTASTARRLVASSHL